ARATFIRQLPCSHPGCHVPVGAGNDTDSASECHEQPSDHRIEHTAVLYRFQHCGRELHHAPSARMLKGRRHQGACGASHVPFYRARFSHARCRVANLTPAFANPAAYGDLAAAILAMIAVLGLSVRAPWAMLAVWIFNIEGTADLLFAYYQ